MRYVKIGDEPGVRRDLLTGTDVYSSRFLNAEEHLNESLLMRVWVALVGFTICTAIVLRRELHIRWEILTFAEAFLAALGVIAIIFFVFIVTL